MLAGQKHFASVDPLIANILLTNSFCLSLGTCVMEVLDRYGNRRLDGALIPYTGEQLRLLQHHVSGMLLLVWRIPVLTEDPFHENA